MSAKTSKRRSKTLGILMLADPHTSQKPPAHGFDDAEWFKYPTVHKTVAKAWAREVVGGNLALTQAYVQAARELEEEGVAAITANCGYTIAHQEAVRNAVSVPVACSSLLQLPLLRSMLPKDGKIGLLCFDANRLYPHYFRLAGLDEASLPNMAIGGIQGTEAWHNWMAEHTKTDYVALERDVMTAARKLWRENPDITHWLLECSGFPWLRPLIKSEFGRPVFDWVTLCNHLMESAPPREI
jgi:hypothetical protein